MIDVTWAAFKKLWWFFVAGVCYRSPVVLLFPFRLLSLCYGNFFFKNLLYLWGGSFPSLSYGMVFLFVAVEVSDLLHRVKFNMECLWSCILTAVSCILFYLVHIDMRPLFSSSRIAWGFIVIFSCYDWICCSIFLQFNMELIPYCCGFIWFLNRDIMQMTNIMHHTEKCMYSVGFVKHFYVRIAITLPPSCVLSSLCLWCIWALDSSCTVELFWLECFCWCFLVLNFLFFLIWPLFLFFCIWLVVNCVIQAILQKFLKQFS